MADPSAEIKGASGHFVDGIGGRMLLPVPQRGMERAAQLLVGVDRQDPVAGGAFGGEILLVGVIGPGAREELRAVLAGDFLRAVRAAGIDNDNFVGDAY